MNIVMSREVSGLDNSSNANMVSLFSIQKSNIDDN